MNHHKTLSTLLLALALTACGGEENNASNNSSGEDMSAPAEDMSADMEEELDMDMGAPDQGEADMERPESPEDCGEQEWFSSLGPTCEMCPAPALTCEGLDLERTEISADDNLFSIAFLPGTLEVDSIQLHYVLYQDFPDGGITPFPEETSMRELGEQYVASPEVPMYHFAGFYDLDHVIVTDGCGTEHRLNLVGSWNINTGTIEEPFACEEP